jgi:predicted component of type VI protein secretion system
MSDHRYLLPPDPAPRQMAMAPGSGPKSEPAKPASPIAPAPTANQSLTMQLAEAREEIALLRSLLHGAGVSLHKLAGQLGHDVEAAAGKARTEADARRRF